MGWRTRWSATLLLMLTLAGCQLAVQHGLDERGANEVVAALERAGIGAEKQLDEGSLPPTFTIGVSRGDGLRALELLRSLGLPRGARAGLGEVYGKPSLIPTPTEERARYVEALQGEIERTLESVDGVTGARVHLVLEERDPLATDGKPRVPAQASVLLKAKPGRAPLPETDVQKLVAGSVPGLAPAQVAVVLTAAPEASPTAELVVMGPMRVSPGTRTFLLLAALGALALVLTLAALLLVMARRLSTMSMSMSTSGSSGSAGAPPSRTAAPNG